MAISKSEHTLELVQDLLDDLELARSSGESLILKASRLARIVGAEKTKVSTGLYRTRLLRRVVRMKTISTRCHRRISS